MHRADDARQASGARDPVGLPDAPLRLWPVLDAAGRHVAIEGVCGKGQILCITLPAANVQFEGCVAVRSKQAREGGVPA